MQTIGLTLSALLLHKLTTSPGTFLINDPDEVHGLRRWCLGNNVSKKTNINASSMPNPMPSPHAHILTNVDKFVLVVKTLELAIGIMELCGGQARVSQLAVRRQLTTSKNFDLVTGVGLNESRDQQVVVR